MNRRKKDEYITPTMDKMLTELEAFAAKATDQLSDDDVAHASEMLDAIEEMTQGQRFEWGARIPQVMGEAQQKVDAWKRQRQSDANEATRRRRQDADEFERDLKLMARMVERMEGNGVPKLEPWHSPLDMSTKERLETITDQELDHQAYSIGSRCGQLGAAADEMERVGIMLSKVLTTSAKKDVMGYVNGKVDLLRRTVDAYHDAAALVTAEQMRRKAERAKRDIDPIEEIADLKRRISQLEGGAGDDTIS